jgi:hypothetical protein
MATRSTVLSIIELRRDGEWYEIVSGELIVATEKTDGDRPGVL